MIRFIDTVFNIFLGLCPWANVLTTFYSGLVEKKHKQAIVSFLLLIGELFLFLNVLSQETFDTNFRLSVLCLLGLIIGAWAYTTIVFFQRRKNGGIKRIISIVISTFLSLLLVVTNIVSFVFFLTKKKYIWATLQFALILVPLNVYLNNLPIQFLFLSVLLNFTAILLWIFINKNDWINDGISIFSVVNQSNSTYRTPTFSGNTEKKGDVIFDKAWTIDDTQNYQVNLLTIEDIIYPIVLKNECEKSTKELIMTIRQLTKSDVTNIDSRGLENQLETYFETVDLSAIRTIFKTSLYLSIEEYSKKDPQYSIYLEKFDEILAR